MGKQEKVLHGSCSEAFINGQRVPLLTKIEVKVTGDFEDGTFCGDYGTYPIYNGYSVEGTLTGKKSDSTLEVAIAEGYRTGIVPDIVLITALTNPVSRQVERWSVSGVVFTDVTEIMPVTRGSFTVGMREDSSRWISSLMRPMRLLAIVVSPFLCGQRVGFVIW